MPMMTRATSVSTAPRVFNSFRCASKRRKSSVFFRTSTLKSSIRFMWNRATPPRFPPACTLISPSLPALHTTPHTTEISATFCGLHHPKCPTSFTSRFSESGTPSSRQPSLTPFPPHTHKHTHTLSLSLFLVWVPLTRFVFWALWWVSVEWRVPVTHVCCTHPSFLPTQACVCVCVCVPFSVWCCCWTVSPPLPLMGE